MVFDNRVASRVQAPPKTQSTDHEGGESRKQAQSMKFRPFLATIGVAALAALALPAAAASAHVAPAVQPTAAHYTSRVHVMKPFKKGLVSPFADTRKGSPPLLFRGGPVMKVDKNYAIYWKPARLQDGSAVTGLASTYQALMNRWFKDANFTGVYATTKQYGGSGGVHPQSTSFGAAYIDTTPFPTGHCTTRYTGANCLTDADIQAEARKIAAAHGFGNSNARIWFVFTPKNEGSCSGSSCSYTEYCAYHGPSVDSAGGVLLYANMPYPVASSVSACTGTTVSPNHNPEADAGISIVSHEQMESVTDPQVNYRSAWYDAAGYENGDECAYQYGPGVYAGGGDVSGNGHSYLVQSEGDNAQRDCSVTAP